MKLINTAQAGEIIGCAYNRVAALIQQGHLKDYSEKKSGAKRHYHKLSEVEVRDFRKKFKLAYRGVEPRPERIPIPVHHASKPNGRIEHEETVTIQYNSPIKSISERLTKIEESLSLLAEQMDRLMKMWS
jgi:hypothetical protein